jgi:mRNA interferase MazF
MKRGDVVTLAMQGDLGKPRPALIIQSDMFSDTATVTILPITSQLIDAPLIRITLNPNTTNGLRKPSQVMLDKSMTIKREKIGQHIGTLEPADMLQINRFLALFLGIAS